MNTPTYSGYTPPPPPPAAEPKKSRKPWYIAGGVGALLVAGAIGAAVSPEEEVSAPEVTVESTEAPVETTEAPATTQAPTTTRATVPPPPPVDNRPDIGDMSQEDFVEALWFETGYCYSDCSRAYTFDEWLTAAEGYGLYAPLEVLEMNDYFLRQPESEMDSFCDGFWVMPDSDIAEMASGFGLSPGAYIVSSYIWCDS